MSTKISLYFITISHLVFILLTTSSAQVISYSTETAPVPEKTPLNNHNIFATNLFKEISRKYNNTNVAFSPFGVETSLATIYLGSEDLTEKEIRSALAQGNRTKEHIAKDFNQIIFDIDKDKSEIQNFNRIYVPHLYKINENYKKFIEAYLSCDIEPAQFWDKEGEAFRINRWIKDRSRKKIENLIAPKDIDDPTAVLLVNAIYFSAQWQLRFESDKKGKFYTTADHFEEVDMFVRNGIFQVGQSEKLDATLIELPYEDSKYRMLIILPNKIEGLKNLDRNLINGFDKISSGLKSENVKLKLPKFRIEFNKNFKASLKKLGIKEVFKNTASLKEIFPLEQPLHVAALKHRVYIEVDAFGTDGVAISATVAATPRSGDAIGYKEPIKEIAVNRPFIFAIRDSNIVLFAGHVINPIM